MSRYRLPAPALVLLSVAAAAPGAPAAGPADAPPPPLRLYEVTTETGMPHLEDNLRYAVVRQRRCLDPQDLSAAFWMLDDVSLQDCRLEKTAQRDDQASYALRCTGGYGTTGAAEWQIGSTGLRGTLDVRLGGKNMTFYQRILAVPVGECR